MIFSECSRCGGSGFETPGTGYDNVCSHCGGQKYLPINVLTIRKLQEINAQRAKRWHGSEGLEQWTVMEWAAAMCGEAGEAANVAKKIRRLDLAITTKDHNRNKLRFKLAEECADVAIYLVLLCEREGLDLEAAIVQKFNQVSEQYGFPERLEETPEEVKE